LLMTSPKKATCSEGEEIGHAALTDGRLGILSP
jgi:hypothetical protein